MAIDLWTFFYPIGCNGKIQLCPQQSRNEHAVTKLYVLVSASCVPKISATRMEPLKPVTSVCTIPGMYNFYV